MEWTALQANNLTATLDSTGNLKISANNDYASSTLGSVAAGGALGGNPAGRVAHPGYRLFEHSAAAEFGAVRVGFHLELGDGIHGRLNHISGAVENVAQICIVVDAVEQKIVLQRAGAVRAKSVGSFDARSGLGRSNSGAE